VSAAAIRAHEEALRDAMLAGDADRLDALLDDGVTFIDPAGRRIGKAEDLLLHRSGLLAIDRLDPVDQHVAVHGDIAIVQVSVRLGGRFDGAPIAGDFAYTRVWRQSDGCWRVIAAQATAIAAS
jgi:ketosteroid isomerase-like protein